MQPTLIVISGPTASGKTALSIGLAQHFDAEIISADSRQFYKKMDIGTAKANAKEKAAAKHHFIDFLDPNQNYNAGKFEHDVLAFLETYFQTKSTAIMVGGSGLYLNAIKFGLDNVPSTSSEIRDKWARILEENGLEFLQNKLKELDPEYYQKVDLQNHQRVQRALEAIETTGRTFTELRENQIKPRPFNIIEIQLLPDRDWLYERINKRVDLMFEEGLLNEVKSLSDYRNYNALQTVGYKEIFDYLDEKVTLEDAKDKIKQHTRNFAKRQFTWFKKYSGQIILRNSDISEALKQLKQEFSV